MNVRYGPIYVGVAHGDSQRDMRQTYLSQFGLALLDALAENGATLALNEPESASISSLVLQNMY